MSDDLLGLQTDPQAPRYGVPGTGSTNVQWKNTDACLDLSCICGLLSHFDGEHASFLRCPSCGTIYALPTNLSIRPLSEADLALVPADLVRHLRPAGEGR